MLRSYSLFRKNTTPDIFLGVSIEFQRRHLSENLCTVASITAMVWLLLKRGFSWPFSTDSKQAFLFIETVENFFENSSRLSVLTFNFFFLTTHFFVKILCQKPMFDIIFSGILGCPFMLVVKRKTLWYHFIKHCLYSPWITENTNVLLFCTSKM